MPLQEEEFTQIYNTHFAKVLRLCKGYVNGEQATATDLAQEVFMKVWQHRTEFRSDASVSTWIYRIAVNTCLLRLRKAATNKEVQTDTLPDRAEETDELAREERFQQLYAAIYQLDNTDRLLILLVLDGLPYEEIAGIVGISESLLRVKIHRIKKRLAKLIQS